MPTPHYERVRKFMQKAGQSTPDAVTVPERTVRLLRASLILEEALETLQALGVSIEANGTPVTFGDFTLAAQEEVDLEGVVDGCADISVVTVGTLIAFGVDDEPVLEEVDRANLRKFGPGGCTREDGKWMKPSDWTPPDIKGVLGL